MTEEEKKLLVELDYYDIHDIPGRGRCGLFRFAFTTGLVYGISKDGMCYEGRYCYPNNIDAHTAIRSWDGIKDPQDDCWVKHKGWVGEWSNPLYNEEDKKDNYDR